MGSIFPKLRLFCARKMDGHPSIVVRTNLLCEEGVYPPVECFNFPEKMFIVIDKAIETCAANGMLNVVKEGN